jgi:serine/threonine-protein kinase
VFLCRRDDEPSFVKLVDFGISKLQQRPGVDTLTHEGAVLGTAFYMSPEQAQSFPDIDGRTDLFSVGAMLYEMLTGEPPHSAPTYEAVLIAICTRDAPDVRHKAPDVPENWQVSWPARWRATARDVTKLQKSY